MINICIVGFYILKGDKANFPFLYINPKKCTTLITAVANVDAI